MATIISQLNLMMMGSKCHDKVLGFPFPTRQVTSINFPSSFKSINQNSFNSRRLSIAYDCTSSSLQEKNYDAELFAAENMMIKPGYNNDAQLFAAENFTMIKPGVRKSTNPTPSGRNFVDMLSRFLASLLTYGVVFTFVTMAACLYISNSALAASYGRISGSSSSSSSSSGSSSSVSYYGYRSSNGRVDFSHTCTCDTSCMHCIESDCDIRENGYKVEEEKEEEEEEEKEEEDNSSTNSCSCKCHSDCYFHRPIDHLSGFIAVACLIFYFVVIASVESEKLSAGKGTMLIFQAGVWDKKRILQRNLNNIAENADTSTLDGLNCVLKEVVRALLQHDNSSLNYCYLFENYHSMESLSKDFREVLDRLLKGCNKDDNTLGNVDGVIYRKHADIVNANRSVDNEYTVATIMVLASGHHWFPTKKENWWKKYVDSLAVLQTLQRIPKNNIQSVEVLWSPQKEDEVLFEETIRRCTTMTRVNNGRIFV